MTETSKLDKAHDHMHGIDRHYQYGTHTVGPCPTVGCEDMGRGGGLCAFCHEAKLAEYAGDRLAVLYHGAVIQRSDAYHAIREWLEEEETKDDKPRGAGDMKYDFSKRLTQLRAGAGLTQSELEQRAKLPNMVVSHYETGARTPNLKNIRALCKGLGCTATDLLCI